MHFDGNRIVMHSSQQHTEQNRFHTVVIFGDSHSDTGNVYKLTDSTWPIVPPYHLGRFTDNLNWADGLKVSNVKNYAHGGATIDSAVIQGYTKSDTVAVPGIRQQIEMYIDDTRKETTDFAHTLFIISGGTNDFVFSNVPNPLAIAHSLINAVNDLIEFGVQHILVFNQPPAEEYPYARALRLDLIYKEAASKCNEILLLHLEKIQRDNSHISINIFNLYSIIKKIIDNESKHFLNTSDQCWAFGEDMSIIVHSPDSSQYVFIDAFHYTSGVHKIISNRVNEFLSNEQISFVYPSI